MVRYILAHPKHVYLLRKILNVYCSTYTNNVASHVMKLARGITWHHVMCRRGGGSKVSSQRCENSKHPH